MKVEQKRKPYRSKLRDAAVEETRERVIAATRRLLAGGQGTLSFSLDAVARAAGVTRLTVYNQFESKRGLLEAVFNSIAREGGLLELRTTVAERDLRGGLRRVVSIMCRFWDSHSRVVPRLLAFARLDDEIAETMRQGLEGRRSLLQTLVGRFSDGRPTADLVDILFALTSFELHELLRVGNRSGRKVESLIQELVTDAVRRHLGAT